MPPRRVRNVPGFRWHVSTYCLFGVDKINFFCIFIFDVLTVVLLKGMGESFLLSKDEPLTPNIDGVVAL